jgi:hypothetical protein
MDFEDDVKAREASAARDLAYETERSRRFQQDLHDFVEAAKRRGIMPGPLFTYVFIVPGGKIKRYRSSVMGWTIDREFGIGEDGTPYGLRVTQGWFTDKSPRANSWSSDLSDPLNIRENLTAFIARNGQPGRRNP